jgi:hypothetical protein
MERPPNSRNATDQTFQSSIGIGIGGTGVSIPTTILPDAIQTGKSDGTSNADSLGNPIHKPRQDESSHGTTWEDLDKTRYVLFGSLFVFSVDSIMYPFEVLRTRMQADNVPYIGININTEKKLTSPNFPLIEHFCWIANLSCRLPIRKMWAKCCKELFGMKVGY